MKKRFFVRSFLGVAAPAVIVVIILGVMAVLITMHSAQENVVMENQQNNLRVAESSQLIFNEVDTQNLNYSVSPYTFLKLQKLLDDGYSDKDNLNTSYMIKSFLDSNVNSKKYMHSIYIYIENKNKNFFASSVGLANKDNFKDIDWFKVIEDNENRTRWVEKRQVSIYLLSDYSTDVITIYRNLYSNSKITPIGAVVLNIKQKAFNDFLETFISNKNFGTVILNKEGECIASAGIILEPDLLSDTAKFQKRYISSSIYDEVYDITYLSFVSRQQVFAEAYEIIVLVLLVVLVTFVIAIIIIYGVTKRDAENVNAIINLLASADEGGELVVNKTHGDEFSFILQNILKTYILNSQLDKQLVEKKYKLEAMHFSFLQSQLNPHFLFNTLRNIFWKTMKLTGGINDAGRMIDLLTALLHFALVDPNRFVGISEEIENTQKYLEIQKMRFDDGFDVFWHVDEKVKSLKCIKFILQPFLENTISHGFSGSNKRGKIDISINLCGDEVNVAISDNGSGFEKKKLEEINEFLKSEESPSQHIGLYNTNKRLLLAYGDDAGLKIKSEPGVKTTIEFNIKKEKNINIDSF